MLGWANNEIKTAAGKFLNIDFAAFENINSCVAVKLRNNYIVRIKLLQRKKQKSNSKIYSSTSKK